MAGKTAELCNSFSRGVIDPLLWERIDLEHYYLGLAKGLNTICAPQGGLLRRPGTMHKTRLRRRLAPVPYTATMVTAHNGGNPAFLMDQDPATLFTTSSTTDQLPFVIAEVDFGAPKTVAFADVKSFSCATSGAERCIVVEYWDGAAWRPMPGSGDPALSPHRSIATSARTRRFGGPPGWSATSQNWRLTLYPISPIYGSGWIATGIGAISVGGLLFWSETQQLSNARYIAFSKEAQETFQLVLTDRNIDVFWDGLYYASAPVAIANEIVRSVKFEQSLDTLICFHQDVKPPWLQRQGASDEWGVYHQTWTNLPNLTPSTAFSGNTNEVQRLDFSGLAAGDAFVFALGDMLTGVLTYSTPEQLTADLSAALDALPGITADLSMTVLSASPLSLSVAFVDANGSRRWPPLSFIPLPDCQGFCETEIIQKGVAATGPIMGETTGWPNCGLVHQSRLMLAGFRSAPSTWLMSRVGGTDFTLTGSPQTADMGIQGTIDSGDVEEINHLFIGTRLHIFTAKAEWWSDNVTFDATKTTDIICATRYGAAPEVFPCFVQGGTLFVQDGGDYGALANTVVRDFVYQFETSNYVAEPISILGAHLFTDISSIAHCAGTTAKHASLVYFVNADGGFAIMTLLKSQDITAIMPAATQGKMIDIGADLLRRTWAIAERPDAAGQPDNHLELFDAASILDAAVTYTGAAASVDLPSHLAGQTVFALIDGDIYGPLTPASATLELPVPASSYATVGFRFDIDIEPLPWRPNPKQAQPLRKMVRVFEAELSLKDSGPLVFSANDGPFIDAPIRHFDGGPLPQEATGEEPANDWFDTPMMSRLYSGYVKMDGLDGWTRFGRWRIQQPVPAPLLLRSVRYQIAFG